MSINVSADKKLWCIPYGLYICEGGREVIFNFRYAPLWERRDKVATPADSAEWEKFLRQEYFVPGKKKEILQAFKSGRDVRKFIERPKPKLVWVNRLYVGKD
jgi:hypothetical protein